MDVQRSDETLGADGPTAQAKALPAELANHPDYEIVRALGAGGMGLVFLARNRLMDRHEVLKIIGPEVIEAPGMRDRFRREIRAVARLRHPNIVTAYSAFRAGESLVFAMEYAEGLDLARMVSAKGPMPAGHACAFIHQAALGLQHAHLAGLVHRDIKPDNLVLTHKAGRAIIKMLDFGLAKAGRELGRLDLAGTARASREPRAAEGLTLAGQTLGTPEFIAPEQIGDAQAADIRADIYSLGCTLYYLLSGRPPFEGLSLPDVLQAHYSMDALPLNQVRPELPADLAAVVTKMMAKDPGHRFQTPDEASRALAPFFEKQSKGHGVPGPGAPRATDPEAVPSPTATAAAAAGTGAREWSDLVAVEQFEGDGNDASAEPKWPRLRLTVTLLASAGVAALAVVLLGVVVAFGLNESKTWFATNRPSGAVTTAAEATAAKREPTAREPGPERTNAQDGHIAKAGGPIAKAVVDNNHGTEPNAVAEERPSRAATPKAGNETIVDSARGRSLPMPASKPLAAAPPPASDLPEIAAFKTLDRAIQARLLPDERHVLYETGGDKPALWLGDINDPNSPRKLEGHTGPWVRLALPSDGRVVVMVCADKTLRNWDLQTGKSRLICPETSSLTALALSSDGRRVAYIDGDTIQTCDVVTGSNKRLGTPTGGVISQLAFRPDGRRVISIGDDDNIRVWDVESGREVGQLSSRKRVTHLAVFPDAQRVMTSFSEPNIGIWDVAARQERRRISVAGSCIALSPDGQRALIGGEKRMRLWDLETDEELKRVDHQSELRDVAFSPDGRRAVSCTDGAVRVWELPPGRAPGELPALVEVGQFLGHEGIVHIAIVSRDGQSILTGGWPNTIRLWNLEGRQLIRSIGTDAGAIQSLAFSPRGDQALSGGDDGRVRLWNLESGEQIREFHGHVDHVFTVAFSPDARRAYSAGGGIPRDGWQNGTDFAIRAWDLRSGEQLQPFEGHTGYVSSLAISPEGTRLLSGGNDAMIILWDMKTGGEIHRFKGHTARVECVAFLPDGPLAVSCGLDGTIRMWNLKSGRELPGHFTGHSGPNHWLARSPDGHRLFSSDAGGRELRFWDIDTGKLIQRLNFGGMPPTRGTFTPDGRHAIWGGWDGVVRMYRVQKPD